MEKIIVLSSLTFFSGFHDYHIRTKETKGTKATEHEAKREK
jgi:hypothetical protein